MNRPALICWLLVFLRLGFEPNAAAQICVVESPEAQIQQLQPRFSPKVSSLGVKKVLFVRVDFADDVGAPETTANLTTVIDRCSSFYQTNSFGDCRLSSLAEDSRITPVIRMPQLKSWYTTNGYGKLRTDALDAVASSNSLFNITTILFSRISAYSWWGLSSGDGRTTMLNGHYNANLIEHEHGHLFGLNHAGSWVSSTTNPIATTGTHETYGDVFDMMGNSSTKYSGTTGYTGGIEHYNIFHKKDLGWIRTQDWLDITNSTVVKLYASDHFSARGGNRMLALRILKPSDSTRTYWLGYRQMFTDNSWLINGLNIHFKRTPAINDTDGDADTQLLDMTPGTHSGHDAELEDSPLVIGKTLSDATDNIHITAIGHGADLISGSSVGWIDVVVNLNVPSTNAPPTATLNGPSQTGLNIASSFNIAATDPDGDALSYYWDFSDDNGSTYNLDFQSSNTNTISKSWTTTGNKKVRCIVSDRKGHTATKTLAVTVTTNFQSISITSQPQNQSVTVTSNATFTVGVTGSSPQYQWAFNGAPVSGATNSTFTRSNVQSDDAGSYFVIITNTANTVTSSAAVLTVNVPPTITSQPQNAAVNATSNASFTVSVSGTTPFGFQWRYNAASISGATLSAFTRTNVLLADVGSYSVVVTNMAGVATSANAMLSLNQPPSITLQPQSRTAGQNSDVIFTVGAGGTTPLAYQWRFNGVNVASATNSAYTRLHVQSQDVGSYSVVVSNVAGSVTSGSAALQLSACAIQPLTIVSNADGSIGMQWSSDPGNTYTLQYTDSLADAQWRSVISVVANAGILTLAQARTNAQKFYRLASDCTESDPSGFMELDLPGNSDSFVSLPFVRPAAATAVVGSITGNVITPLMRYPASWTSNQFVYVAGTQPNKYYVRFTSGAAQGPVYTVTANGTNSVTVDISNNSLASAAAGGLFMVQPYWTLKSAFPNGAGINISPTMGDRKTEVLIPDDASSGINLGAAKIYFFHAGVWKQVGQGNVDHGDDILPLNGHFVVRHNVATNTTLLAIGVADTSSWAIPLRTANGASGDKQDNYIGLPRPLSISLDATGLITSGAFAPSPLPGTRSDELLVFDNSIVAKNKSSSAVYYYWNSAWRRVGAGSNIVGSDIVFTPGIGVIIRKGTNTASPVWTNAPSY